MTEQKARVCIKERKEMRNSHNRHRKYSSFFAGARGPIPSSVEPALPPVTVLDRVRAMPFELPASDDARALREFAVNTMLRLAAADESSLIRFKAAEWIGVHSEKLIEKQNHEDPARVEALAAIEKILGSRGIIEPAGTLELEVSREGDPRGEEGEAEEEEAGE
jgi:hypothetical protein